MGRLQSAAENECNRADAASQVFIPDVETMKMKRILLAVVLVLSSISTANAQSEFQLWAEGAQVTLGAVLSRAHPQLSLREDVLAVRKQTVALLENIAKADKQVSAPVRGGVSDRFEQRAMLKQYKSGTQCLLTAIDTVTLSYTDKILVSNQAISLQSIKGLRLLGVPASAIKLTEQGKAAPRALSGKAAQMMPPVLLDSIQLEPPRVAPTMTTKRLAAPGATGAAQKPLVETLPADVQALKDAHKALMLRFAEVIAYGEKGIRWSNDIIEYFSKPIPTEADATSQRSLKLQLSRIPSQFPENYRKIRNAAETVESRDLDSLNCRFE